MMKIDKDEKKDFIEELKNFHNYSTFEYNNFVNNEFIIKRKSDLLNIVALEFDNCVLTKHEYENANFVIESNNKIIINLPLKILMELNKLCEYDNKIYLKIDYNWFLQDLLIINMKYSSVKISITNIDITNITIRLLTKQIFCDENTRKYICDNNNLSTVQTINILHNNYINTNSNINTYTFNLLSNKKYKGFFIKTNDFNNINHIKLYNNNNNDNVNVFYYDKFLCKNVCVSLSDTLLYIPISINSKYNERTYMDIYNSLWAYEDLDYVLEISFNDKVMTDILIYELCIDFCATIDGIFDILHITKYDSWLIKSLYLRELNSIELN